MYQFHKESKKGGGISLSCKTAHFHGFQWSTVRSKTEDQFQIEDTSNYVTFNKAIQDSALVGKAKWVPSSLWTTSFCDRTSTCSS